MLNGCLDTRMASALRTHKKITAETEINTPDNGCLDILREIFLEKNPLWLRRHWYFQCVQAKDESVEQWWSRKLDKARECDLRNITAEEIGMLELIRGIDNQALRREFLKQCDPTLDGLLQIAKNWQRSTDVNKNMESTVDSRKTSNSNYQKGKAKDWKKKSDDKAENSNKSGDNKSNGKGPDDKSNGKGPNDKSNGMKKCKRCGYEHSGKPCPANGETCLKCGKTGHFQAVCKAPKATNSRVGRIQVVNCRRVATKVHDDSDPIPMMEVQIDSIGKKKMKKTRPTTMEVFPDTGCQQSLVSEDLVGHCGLKLDESRKKKIKAVDGNTIPCSGSTEFPSHL